MTWVEVVVVVNSAMVTALSILYGTSYQRAIRRERDRLEALHERTEEYNNVVKRLDKRIDRVEGLLSAMRETLDSRFGRRE